MTPHLMAAIHASSFSVPRPWSEAEFKDLIGDSLILREVEDKIGFGLARAVADEAELLTIAVLPESRGQGTGTRLLAALMAGAQRRGAATMFLEVAHGNTPAIRLYERAGFRLAGRRPRYYDDKLDALIYRAALS